MLRVGMPFRKRAAKGTNAVIEVDRNPTCPLFYVCVPDTAPHTWKRESLPFFTRDEACAYATTHELVLIQG